MSKFWDFKEERRLYKQVQEFGLDAVYKSFGCSKKAAYMKYNKLKKDEIFLSLLSKVYKYEQEERERKKKEFRRYLDKKTERIKKMREERPIKSAYVGVWDVVQEEEE